GGCSEMTRDAEAVGAAWGRLARLAVDLCQSHHAAHQDGESHEKKTHGKKEHRGTVDPDPNGEVSAFTLTPHQRCRPTTTPARGVVVLSFEQSTLMQFDYTAVHLLPAHEPLTKGNGETATPNPMSLTGPGAVEVR